MSKYIAWQYKFNVSYNTFAEPLPKNYTVKIAIQSPHIKKRQISTQFIILQLHICYNLELILIPLAHSLIIYQLTQQIHMLKMKAKALATREITELEKAAINKHQQDNNDLMNFLNKL